MGRLCPITQGTASNLATWYGYYLLITRNVSRKEKIIGDGVKDFDNGGIYKLDDILFIQHRIPYDLIDDEGFMRFLGR